MGVRTPTQLLKMVGMGADMFDCVMPSQYTSWNGIHIEGDLEFTESKISK